MLGSVMNDIEHSFVDTVSTERILQWRAMIQELISVGFAVGFVLDHLHEVARAFFTRRFQPVVETIDARIEILSVSTFFLALVGLAVLEIRLSFSDSVDDNAVPFFFVFLLLLLHPEHLYVSYSTYLVCVCHSLGL